MKRLFTAMIALLLVFSFMFVSGCGNNADIYEDQGDPNEHLVMYFPKNPTSQDDMRVYVNKYNNICDESDKIDIVEFDTVEEMRTTMSTEMMAGEGPDLICDSSLNLYSYIENEMLADINILMEKDESKDKIDLSNYNEVVMNAGVFEGKRVIIPLTYLVSTYMSTEEQLEKYNIPTDIPITYDNVEEIFAEFLEVAASKPSMDISMWFNLFVEQLVLNNIDFESKTTTLESDEFRSELHRLMKINLNKEFSQLSNNRYDGSYLITEVSIGELNSLIKTYVGIINEYSQTPCFVNNLFSNGSEVEAIIDRFISININSKQKDKAYSFVKYLLDETSYKGIKGGGVPTNNVAFETMLQKAENYNQNNTTYEYVDTDKFIKKYNERINNITKCNLYNEYYRNEILFPEVVDLVDGQLSEDTFINKIHSMTLIYFDE